ncbi:hypothetical protein Taro_009953, partial [Colocasia esculenta]|nr:hypothetical protein [Colocasia esculenta]
MPTLLFSLGTAPISFSPLDIAPTLVSSSGNAPTSLSSPGNTPALLFSLGITPSIMQATTWPSFLSLSIPRAPTPHMAILAHSPEQTFTLPCSDPSSHEFALISHLLGLAISSCPLSLCALSTEGGPENVSCPMTETIITIEETSFLTSKLCLIDDEFKVYEIIDDDDPIEEGDEEFEDEVDANNIFCKGSVDTTILGVDTMVQNKGRNVKKSPSQVDTSPGQVDTEPSQVDTRDLSQGLVLPVWDS